MIQTLKVCKTCSLEKSSEHFHVKDAATGLLHRACKPCRSKDAANDYKENRERFTQRNTRWKQANPQKVAVQRLAWQRANRDKVAEYNRKFHAGNADVLAERRKHDKKKDPEKFAVRMRDYAKANRPVINSNRRKKLATDLHFRIGCLLRGRLSSIVRCSKGKKIESALRLVGCSVTSLITHLKTTMPQGGSWADVLAGRIHIDHIKPCALFDLTDLEEQRKCFHFSNLQLLWDSDNKRKWKHYMEPPVAACMAGIVTAFEVEIY